ncbi:PREDICTED: cholinesterase 2-like isoform X2 [Papilio polytes]|uniref:cholinesterase 2-like isoform X2 n=1 Tax=Papilio polytes TaxID=76194 RepID=UPI000675FE05|nr:PREDICTED: cholinesterase 2-like isoform X2 [Papilio polytes]
MLQKFNDYNLEGVVTNNEYGGKIYSFKGIPYAQPPLGELRFKAPQPPKSWPGVRDATKLGDDCYQHDAFFGLPPQGSEDCLYLNVYSPNVSPARPLPVMVWIHGGGFISGSGSDDTYGPDFLVRHDVILVTINYRLEVLGFLCLNTAEVPGNAGMKDQVAALRWVQTNIASFGGDPDNVTIFGESAGGASVSFHLLSPMSKGLFKRAIQQSGTAMCPWATSFMLKERSLGLAREMGCTSTNEKDVYEFFKSQPVEALIRKSVPLTYAEANKECSLVEFCVTVEQQFSSEESFMPDDPINLLHRGIHEGVEVMNGYTEDEGVMMLGLGNNIHDVFVQAKKYAEYFVPRTIALTSPISDQIEVGKILKKHYFDEKELSMENIDCLYAFIGAENFIYPAIFWQKKCASFCNNKTFLYKFTCKSERNFFKHLFGVADLVGEKTVACHGDELPYLFPMRSFGAPLDRGAPAFGIVCNMTALWTNFAKYGNPTPDESLGAIWQPYTLKSQDYLDIGENLVARAVPDKDDIEFWETIYKKYCPKYAP